MGKSSINGPFSMAMLNNQRVTILLHPEQKGPTSNICGLGIVEESPGTRQGVKTNQKWSVASK